MIEFLNTNAGAVTALATVALLCVTGWYAFTTWALLNEAKQSRLLASEPRVVAYLRAHEVHSNIVQLCIANLSGAPAVGVSATIEKTTAWPTRFDLEDSKILRDLSFLRPQEVVKLDLGFGPDLFNGDETAVFQITIRFSSADGRPFTFEDELKVESVIGPSWRIYSMDDVARRLQEISDTLKSFTGFKRLQVEVFNAEDREVEERQLDEMRERHRQRSDNRANEDSSEPRTPPTAAP